MILRELLGCLLGILPLGEIPAGAKRLLRSINIFFANDLSRRKMSKSEKLDLLSAHNSKGLCERILTLSAAETAATEDSDTQSEDDDVSVNEDSESEDELLLEQLRRK